MRCSLPVLSPNTPDAHNTRVHALTVGNILFEKGTSDPRIGEITWGLIDASLAIGDGDLYEPLSDQVANLPNLVRRSQWGLCRVPGRFRSPPMIGSIRPSTLCRNGRREAVGQPTWPWPGGWNRSNRAATAGRYFTALMKNSSSPTCMTVSDAAGDLKTIREQAQRPRSFTMYYATLHRGAGQRVSAARMKRPRRRATSWPWDRTNDVMLPSPWLVPLAVFPTPMSFKRPTDAQQPHPRPRRSRSLADVVPRGVPTEATITLGNTDDDYRVFFSDGTQIIDHENGQVYTVVKSQGMGRILPGRGC